jgi:DNA-directed RNA polymerase subunit beta'
VGDVLDTAVFAELRLCSGSVFQAQSGAQAIRTWLQMLDLNGLAEELRASIACSDKGMARAVKHLQVVEALRTSKVDPTWMILSVLPVLPPDLRPLVPLDSGRLATSDLNTLYERIVHRNNRIKQLQGVGAPTIILNNERRMLQSACDALFDNKHQSRPVLGPQKHPLKSLTDVISGKQGRFRRNLLGKRVDYSGRSVIVGDPTLSLHQCGLPTKICLELFKPFLIAKLVERHVGLAPNLEERRREKW